MRIARLSKEWPVFLSRTGSSMASRVKGQMKRRGGKGMLESMVKVVVRKSKLVGVGWQG